MTYDQTRRSYSYIDGELPFKPRQPGTPRTAQVLPRKNYDPVEMARLARHQAREEAKQRSRTTAYTNNEEYVDADIDGNGDIFPPPPPTIVYRYDTAVSDGGNVRYQFHPDQVQHILRRSSRTAPAQGQRVRQTPRPAYAEDEGDELRTERQSYRRRIHLHWLVFVGIGAIIALSAWIGVAWVNVWWTNTQDDWTYTQAFRTFSIDAVVGHNHDSSDHPSHFIVQNDKRHIIIIELPADDFSKSIIYSAPTLIGDGQEKTPATISFQANMQTGRLDLVLHVQDQTYIFTNNGTKFVTPSGQWGGAIPPKPREGENE